MVVENLIFLNHSAKSRDEVLDVLINNATNLEFINNKEAFKKAVLDREEIIPTSVGFNVAIPHGRNSGVTKPFISFMRTSNEFIWDETNMERVDFIFMIGVPEENEGNLHLKYLAAISKRLMNEDFRDSLRAARTSKEAFDLLDQINQTL